MKRYLVLGFFVFGVTACTKIINVDLNDAPSQLVIEGIVNDVDAATVIISSSVVFSSANTFPPVSGALVTIRDDAGNTYTLSESVTRKGTYSTGSVIGIPGRNYTMNINVNGKTYTAESRMPAVVNLDSLKADEIYFGKPLKVVTPMYTDPPGRGNYYQLVEFVNRRFIKNIYAWYDNVNDGGTNTRRLIYNDEVDSLNIKRGDTVAVELRCIDKNMFNYMYALADLSSSQTIPANPVNAITGGALGYFSAHTSRTKRIVMP
jgi:hypothetical protein